jgi:hypothetical protein
MKYHIDFIPVSDASQVKIKELESRLSKRGYSSIHDYARFMGYKNANEALLHFGIIVEKEV